MSLPVRGAWIEILCQVEVLCTPPRRSPCGERGLKCEGRAPLRNAGLCRSPCGERGLKFIRVAARAAAEHQSLPVRGAWIEIVLHRKQLRTRRAVAPRAGSVD